MQKKRRISWHHVEGVEPAELTRAAKESLALYGDILTRAYPFPLKRGRMPREDRAVQFAPFAALTGYEAAVRETARLTEDRAELDEDRRGELDRILQEMTLTGAGVPVRVTRFVADEKKAGGRYEELEGVFCRIDRAAGKLILDPDGKGKTEIAIEDIRDMRLMEGEEEV